jgi:hypothetical protein
MNTFTATLFIETNPLSREKLACGLLAITPQKLFFEWAEAKVKMAEGLAEKEYKGYFQQRLRTIERALKDEDRERQQTTNGLFQGLLSQSHFERLEQYNAGPVQFGDIKPYGENIDARLFAKLFKETVHHPVVRRKRSGSGLYWAVLNKLDRPAIVSKADVQYELPEESIDGLIYNAKLSMITVNGSIQAMQAVDMNKSLTTVVQHLNETEMIYHQLVKLGKQKSTPVERVKLVYQPEGEESDLVKKVRSEKSDVFELMPLGELDQKLERMENDPSYRRFSEFIEA